MTSPQKAHISSAQRAFISSAQRARGGGNVAHPIPFTETSVWEFSGTIKHWRTVNSVRDATPTDDITIANIQINFQFYKAYTAMFGISTHEYESIKLGGYTGAIDPQNDTLDPTKHSFTRWTRGPFSTLVQQNMGTAMTDHPQGGGVGMGVDASFIRYALTTTVANLDGSIDSPPDGFLTHAAELDSGNGPIQDFDLWRILVYYPAPGISSFFSGDTGSPDFHPIRSELEIDLQIDITG